MGGRLRPLRDAAVLIPVYADRGTLARAVASVGACERVGRVIVVDDGSPVPAPAEGVRGAAPEGVEVEVIRQANAGASAARNAAMDAMLRREEIRVGVFLDADDELLPGAGTAIEELDRSGALAVLGGRTIVEPGREEREKPPPEEWLSGNAGRVPGVGDCFRPILLFSTTGVVFARRVAEAGIRLAPELKVAHDREWLARVRASGEVRLVREPVVRYYHEALGESLTSRRRIGTQVADLRWMLERHPDAGGVRWMREQAVWLLGQGAKHGASDADWAALVGLFRERGWGVPLKPRLRRWLGRGSRHGAHGTHGGRAGA